MIITEAGVPLRRQGTVSGALAAIDQEAANYKLIELTHIKGNKAVLCTLKDAQGAIHGRTYEVVCDSDRVDTVLMSRGDFGYKHGKSIV